MLHGSSWWPTMLQVVKFECRFLMVKCWFRLRLWNASAIKMSIKAWFLKSSNEELLAKFLICADSLSSSQKIHLVTYIRAENLTNYETCFNQKNKLIKKNYVLGKSSITGLQLVFHVYSFPFCHIHKVVCQLDVCDRSRKRDLELEGDVVMICILFPPLLSLLIVIDCMFIKFLYIFVCGDGFPEIMRCEVIWQRNTVRMNKLQQNRATHISCSGQII